MDSDDEDVSENEILQWYSERVDEIWDSATDSAFNSTDLGSTFTNMFRQIMNNVRQRNPPTVSMLNGHSSVSNGHASSSEEPRDGAASGDSSTEPRRPANVAMSAEQLMQLLQDDEEWLDDDGGDEARAGETMQLSVELTPNQTQQEQDQKNVKRVSQEIDDFLADSSFISIGLNISLKVSVFLFKSVLLCIGIAFTTYLVSLFCHPLRQFFLRRMQNYIYPVMRIVRLVTLPLLLKFPSLTGKIGRRASRYESIDLNKVSNCIVYVGRNIPLTIGVGN